MTHRPWANPPLCLQHALREQRRALRRRAAVWLAPPLALLALGAAVALVRHGGGGARDDAAAQAAPRVAAELPARAAAAQPGEGGLLERGLLRLPSARSAFEQLQPGADGLLREHLEADPAAPHSAALDITYSFQRELSERVFALLQQHRVALGHVILADARSGRVLVYASTDPERFPPTGLYPAASLVKVVTAAATLRRAPELLEGDCHFRGSPYRLSRGLLTPPARGATASFRRALATSNNQCFAQLAVNALGPAALLEELAAFGWLRAPAPGHAAGRVTTGSDAYAIGRLGSGLGGSEITPLHAAQLALLLASGNVQQPYWIEHIATDGRELELPRGEAVAVLSPSEVVQLRELLVETTRSGTARRAFQNRGRPLLAPLTVAGKTGSLTGTHPAGRYEWFVGVAPAEDPQVAIAVVTVHQGMWWRSASQLSAEILRQMFCPSGVCSPSAGARWLRPESPVSVPRPRPAHSPSL